MRLFTAIDMPEKMSENVGELIASLRHHTGARWSRVENLHITTKFIGEWPESRLDEMKNALAGVKQPGPIEIIVSGAGTFPGAIWLGVNGDIAPLAHGTEQAVARLGVPLEKRAYTPHITLARAKNPAELPNLSVPILYGSFHASSFFLYLSSNGKYSKLAEFPFIP